MTFDIRDMMPLPAEDGWRKCLTRLPDLARTAGGLCFCDSHDPTPCKHCRALEEYTEALVAYIEDHEIDA